MYLVCADGGDPFRPRAAVPKENETRRLCCTRTRTHKAPPPSCLCVRLIVNKPAAGPSDPQDLPGVLWSERSGLRGRCLLPAASRVQILPPANL